MQQSTVIFSEKNIHTQPITGISTCKNHDSLFLTISEDQTMRLYDLRLSSSVKLFLMDKVQDAQTANCLLSDINVYGVRNNEILLFDIRQEIIIKEQIKKLSQEFDINQISFDPQQQLISANYDSGTTDIFDRDLKLQCQLKGAHENVCFSGDFIQDEEQQLYVTTGFDYKIALWELDGKLLHKFDLSKIHETYAPLTASPPVIYSATSKNNNILISTETGQVYCFKVSQLKRKKNKKPPVPEFVIDAHTSKVMRSTFLQDKIITISNDETCALWNSDQQIIRMKIKNKPNWVEGIGEKTILIGDISNKLSIFEIV